MTPLADHFGTSVAFLVGEDVDAEDADPQLQQLFRRAKDLNEGERAILEQMLNSLIANRETRRGG